VFNDPINWIDPLGLCVISPRSFSSELPVMYAGVGTNVWPGRGLAPPLPYETPESANEKVNDLKRFWKWFGENSGPKGYMKFLMWVTGYDAESENRDKNIGKKPYLEAKKKGKSSKKPDSIERIERDKSGARGDRHVHGKGEEWSINEDGTKHDNNSGRIPKDAADYLRDKGFNIPEDRYPLPN
jgi:hypothetical protein